jgi:hypothetical protein
MLGMLVVLALVPAGSARAASGDATTVLAEKYAPIVVVREQVEACGEGEPFRPTPVTTVLGRPDVVLRGPAGEQVAAPTAADLAGKGEGWYLDYPGDPLAPACDYETWFADATTGEQPTLYARAATDPQHPGKLALQYWFFYTFNDWNDKHEGDWEMVQVVLPATTPEQALTVTPESVAYAQHEGSQTSPWDAGELIRVGERPVVYPGQGSHAAYFRQEQWFGKSAAAGFGCDNTTAPGVELQPQVVVLPQGAPPTTGDFAWLSFTGRWGERAPSFNNGPTGPSTKDQWSDPITWQVEEGRTSAVSLPAAPGPALSTFCDVSESASLLFIDLLGQPVVVAGILVALLGLALWLITRTEWRQARSDDPDRMRSAGQIVTAAFGWVRRNVGNVLGISAVAFVAAALARGLLNALAPVPDAGDITGVTATYSTLSAMVLLAASLGVVVVAGWVAASITSLVHADAEGRWMSSGRALRAGFGARAGMATAVAVSLAAVLLTASVVLLPLAGWFLAVFAPAPAAAVVEGLGVRAAFHRSARLTKGRRWRTLLVQTLLMTIGLALAGLVGTALLLLTGWPLWVNGLITAVLAAVLLPVAFAGTALQFYDLRHRAGDSPRTSPRGDSAPAPLGGDRGQEP